MDNSLVGHLAYSLFLNHNESTHYFAVFSVEKLYSAYFDASGDRRGEVLVVAGYIAPVKDWLTFETEWQSVLRKAKVPYFHMKRFIANSGPFKNEKWRREETRRKFISDLIGITARNVDCCISNVLYLKDWHSANAEYCMEEARMTPYSVAGCMAMVNTFDWCRRLDITPKQLEIFFESGDDGMGDLMYWSQKCFRFVPGFKPKTSEDQDVRLLAPLQACDLIAWEMRRAEKDLADPNYSLDDIYILRRSLEELHDRTQQHDNAWSLEDLRALCEQHNVKKR